jgi:hypothetical protein
MYKGIAGVLWEISGPRRGNAINSIGKDIVWLDTENRWMSLSGIWMLATTRHKIGSDEIQSAV